MDLHKKIKKEENKIFKFKKMKTLGIIILIFGVLYFLIKSCINFIHFFEMSYDGAAPTKVFFQLILLIIKTFAASFLIRVGLFITIIYSNLILKKHINIEKFKEELNK